MASGTQQHQHQYQPQQQLQQQQQRQPHHQQSHQELPMSQQQENQMQFATNQGLSACLDLQQPLHHIDNMSPITTGSMTLDQTQDHMMNTNTHHQQQQSQIMSPVTRPAIMNQDICNHSANQQHHMQQQKSQLLPTLLSPRSTGLKPSDQVDQPHHPASDHDQIIEQVISLEDDFSDPLSAMTNVDNDMGLMVSNPRPQQQQLQHFTGDTNFTSGPCISGTNQLSSLDEDNLLNLLLEFECNPTNMISGQQLDQDEKVGIETIRKQLMSCEVQSDQLLHNNSNSPSLNQISGSGHPQQVMSAQQSRVHQLHQSVQLQNQLISRTSPIMSLSHQSQQHQISTSGLSQQRQQSNHRLSVDHTVLHGTYTNAHLGNAAPVSSSGQSYNPQGMSRITQSIPMSIDNNSPSPSWQQPQLSPYSPQTPVNDHSRPPSQRQHHSIMQSTHSMQSQQHPTTTATSPHMQQLHPLQRLSPSQSISPPATTEPSPVVKKNPLLNAQLVNSRAPPITPTRFINNQATVLNQNPILNSKLSQGSFAANNCNTVSSPVNPNLNPPQPPNYVQQQSPLQQQSSSFGYDITRHQNAQQHTPPQTGYMSMYGHGDQQQQTNQIFRPSNANTNVSSSIQPGSPHMNMDSTSPSGGGPSQQVKQEIRKKVQQPKQQHQTTSLLKQLLSDDNK